MKNSRSIQSSAQNLKGKCGPALLFAFAVFLISTSVSEARQVGDLSAGPPAYMNQKLPKSSYIEVTARKLAHPKVVWANFSLLREMGVDLPAEGLTPDFERKILDAFAWAVPNERDKPDSFLNDTKTFYADRYGGNGLGVNWGSGRAASAGEVQVKGIGITPLVGEGQTFDHAHGGASLEESIREAVWGEVNNQELPWGANRIVAIIDTGTSTTWADGGTEARALIVRRDPPRPAWFARAIYGRGKLQESDAARTTQAIGYIDRALPVDPSATTLAARVQSGFNNYVDRMADQYAAAYARGLYHGATSISNFQIDGAYIDYGTETSQAGFAPIKVLNHVGAFGDMSEIKNTLISEFYKGVSRDAPDDVKAVLPNLSDLTNRFSARYDSSLQNEMLALTGAPPEAVAKVAAQDSSKKLSSVLLRLALVGVGGSTNVDKSDPVIIGKYDIREILTRAASVDNNEAALRSVLKDVVPSESSLVVFNKDTLGDFVSSYMAFRSSIESAAAQDSVSKSAINTYFKEAAKIRNRKQVELYRNQMQDRDRALIDAYKQNGDRSPIWREINSNVAAGDRTYRERGPYQLVIKENPDLIQGTSSQVVFDATKNTRVLVYRIELENNYGYFFGNKISSQDLASSSLRTTLDSWKSSTDVPAIQGDGVIEFHIPLTSSNPTPTVEFALHSEDNGNWWKNHGDNAHVSLAAAALSNGSSCVVDLAHSWSE